MAISRMRHLPALACATLVLWLCTATASAGAWEWLLPAPTGNAMRAVAHGANTYVAVGRGGSVLYSGDGNAWSLARAGGPGEVLEAVAYGNGVFVAVGQGGALWRSSNGRDWTRSASPVTTALRSVTYGTAGFVACGGLTLVTSPDGVTWTEADSGVSPGVFGPSLQGVAFGNGVYAVWIDIDPIGASSSAAVLTSVDAATWTLVPLGPFDGHDGVLFARGFVHADGRFVALATSDSFDSLSLTSSDGSTWNAGSTTAYQGNTAYFRSAAFDPAAGRYVALASLNDPPLALDPLPIVMTSANGLDWTGEGLVDHVPLVRLAQAGDRVFGLPSAGGGLYTLAGASTWHALTPASPAWQLSSIVADDSAVIAAGIGAGETSHGTSPTLVASFDSGGTWSTVLTVEGGIADGGFAGLAAGATHRVAVGSADHPDDGYVPLVYASTDGATWTAADLSAVSGDVSGVYGVAYGDGVFVAGAASNGKAVEVLKSTDDGVTWQSHATNLAQPLGRIVYDGDRFAAVSAGFSASVFFSSDGIAWSESTTGTAASYLTDIAYRNGTYVALGLSFAPTGNVSKLVVSAKDVPWASVDAAPTDIVGLSANADGFVATGTGGSVYRSADGRTWTSSWSGSADWITASARLPDGRLAVATVRGGVLAAAADDRIFADGFDTAPRRP